MAICAIKGCPKPTKAHGWCSMHYQRWRRDEDPGGAKPLVVRTNLKVPEPCSIKGCDRPVQAHGWCSGHYLRWYKTGDPGPAQFRVRRAVRSPCRVRDCKATSSTTQGLCAMHSERNKRNGEPGEAKKRRADFGSDDVGYDAIHLRLRRIKGSASAQPCVDCSQPAAQWSYVGGCPRERKERRRGSVLAYSPDLKRYVARCFKCHKAHDGAYAKTKAEAVQTWVEEAFREACDRLRLVPRKDGQRCRVHRNMCVFRDDDPDRCPWCHSRWASIRSSGGHTCTEEEHLHEILKRVS